MFYFDLADARSYLAAERIQTLGAAAEWEPVHMAALGLDPPPLDRERLAAEVQRAGLQPLRLARTWPPDSRLAMLAATYAKGGGRVVAFSLAAFRQTFAGGRDLGDETTVLLAAAASEMHPRAVLRAVGTSSVSQALARACERAVACGVRSLPAFWRDGRLWQGEEALELVARGLETDP